MNIIDSNSAFGFWPIQRFSHPTLESLDRSYEAQGIGEVWLSAVESILYPEPDTFDQLLFEKLRHFPRFRAVKTVNPLLHGWQGRLTMHREKAAIRAIKVYPNYHGYALHAPSADALCRYAQEHRLPLLLQIRVNDERNQPVAMQVPAVSVTEIADLSLRFPHTRLIALCAYRNELPKLAQGSPNLCVDLSFLDGAGMVKAAVEVMGAPRVVFGTHEAFLHANSARQKLQFCDLPEPVAAAIASENLRQAIP